MSTSLSRVWQAATVAWQWLRHLSGDDAYERYLSHARQCTAHSRLLTRTEFEREREHRKWSRISRCC